MLVFSPLSRPSHGVHDVKACNSFISDLYSITDVPSPEDNAIKHCPFPQQEEYLFIFSMSMSTCRDNMRTTILKGYNKISSFSFLLSWCYRLFWSGSPKILIIFPSFIFGVMQESTPKGRISARLIQRFRWISRLRRRLLTAELPLFF